MIFHLFDFIDTRKGGKINRLVIPIKRKCQDVDD